eukprot:TRINITY_DN7029_c0_g2_i1.p1 TRINITY_DN7029_c0_g2~~TRINITY_DN7029_c0_g2_i1.p1  ORF type:complete len:298 (+),score=45.89 TRINITY_DN7029_c0_g2_i1:102-896(+)
MCIRDRYVIKNYMKKEDVVRLTTKCLNEFIKAPNRTNLYIYGDDWVIPEGENAPRDYDKDKYVVSDPKKYHFNKKIRWSNLGYQYDWNNRTYPSGVTSIPQDLSEIALDVIRMMKLGDYKPESVIVNYYDKKNHMGGHLDDGEKDQVHPIISFSMGLSCVFLMGFHTKDLKPLPLKLDSGDVLIMSGYSRTCYHGVPRVIENSFDPTVLFEHVRKLKPELFEGENVTEVDPETKLPKNNELHAVNFLRESRINFNFRQVYIDTS